MHTLSIIVPAYNSAGFLRETVDSLLAQAIDGMELVLVDDGSTDGTGALIDALAAANGCITAIHQPNGGVSAARNRGLAAARGVYTLFLDSDDLYAPGALRKIYDAMEAAQADLGIFEMCRFGYGGTEPNPVAAALAKQTRIDPWDRQLLWNFLLGNKCFRTARLRAHDLQFPPTRYSEDGAFILPYIYAARPVIIGIPGALYGYRRRDPAQGRSVSQTVSQTLAEDFCTSLQLIRTAAETALAAPDCACPDPDGYLQELLFKEHYTLLNEFYRLLWGAEDATLRLICDRCAALEAQMTPATLHRAQTAHPDLGGRVFPTRAQAAAQPQVSILLPRGGTAAFYDALYAQSMPLFEILTASETAPFTAAAYENLRLLPKPQRKAARGGVKLRSRGKRPLDPRYLRVILLLKQHRLARYAPDAVLQSAAGFFLRRKDRRTGKQVALG